MLDSCKMVEKQSEAFHMFLWNFFQVLNRILLHIFLLKCTHVQIAFLIITSRDNQALVYSNCYCSCSFEPEILKIGLSSHKMYTNNVLNFQESTTIVNACTKKSENALRMYKNDLALNKLKGLICQTKPNQKSSCGLNSIITVFLQELLTLNNPRRLICRQIETNKPITIKMKTLVHSRLIIPHLDSSGG